LSSTPSQPRAILIVDDDPIMLRMLDTLLARLANRIVGVSGGARAIESLEREKFALVITDLEMPDVDGFEVLRAVERTQPEARVLVISASRDHPGVELHRKPLDPARFLARVRELLEAVP
jgi:CheY-like chemotaxis protein